MSRHHIIYVPGLSDPREAEKNNIHRFWGVFGVEIHYLPMYWNDSRAFKTKLGDITSLIDQLHALGFRVSLVGTSAGAGAVLNAFALRKNIVSRVVCICGKIQNPQTISDRTYKINPSFKESMALLPVSLEKLDKSDKQRILSLHPIYDDYVPVADTFISGAHNKLFISAGHTISIGYALIFEGFKITGFIKSGDK